MPLKRSIVVILVLALVSPLLAQGFWGSSDEEEEEKAQAEQKRKGPTAILLPRKLIDIPTANMLPRGSFDFDFRAYPNGGIFAAVHIGLMNWFNLGVAYGGENILGEGGVNWNPRVEFVSRIRIIEETYALPSVALGFDSQGSGAYNVYSSHNRCFFGIYIRNYKLFEAQFFSQNSHRQYATRVAY